MSMGQLLFDVTTGLITGLLGVFIGLFIRKAYWDKVFSGWKVIVKKNMSELTTRFTSPQKAREIYSEESDLSVYLKGIAGNYEFINTDILDTKRTPGLLEVIDNRFEEVRNIPIIGRIPIIGGIPLRIQRTYIIDLDKNPPARKQPNAREEADRVIESLSSLINAALK